MLKNSSDDPVFAGVNFYAGLHWVVVHIIDGVGFYQSVFQLNAFFYAFQIFGFQRFIQKDMIYFFSFKTGMGELFGQIPVVGK